MRLASIDVGTNSTRLLVADVADGTVTQHAREMVITRLGKGVDRTGRFDPAALARTLAVIGDYAATCERLGVEAVRLVATSATRDAANAAELAEGVRRLLGVEPEVLSGAEEAAASYLGATYDLDGEALRQQALVYDIGGGSTELMLGYPGEPGGHAAAEGGYAAAEGGYAAAGGHGAGAGGHVAGAPAGLGAAAPSAAAAAPPVPEVHSLDIGSVRLTERHITGDPPGPDEIEAVRADAAGAIAELVPLLAPRLAGGDTRVVGVGGTVTTVTAIALGLPSYQPERVHRATLTAGSARATAERLCAMTVAEKAAIPVMPPGREDVIAAGALILVTILELLGLDETQVSETDILDGVLLGLARRLGAWP